MSQNEIIESLEEVICKDIFNDVKHLNSSQSSKIRELMLVTKNK